jgi:hypothetical protein
MSIKQCLSRKTEHTFRMRTAVLTVVILKMNLLWYMTPYSMATPKMEAARCFKSTELYDAKSQSNSNAHSLALSANSMYGWEMK